MHKQIYQKVFFHMSLLGIILSILVGFYDVIFGYIFEFTHLLFEIVEMGLDKMVEHFFETGVHETQLIVFYLLLAIGGVLVYLVWKTLVIFWDSVSHGIHEEWTSFKDAVTNDWNEMTVANRIIWIVAFFLANYLASFLLF